MCRFARSWRNGTRECPEHFNVARERVDRFQPAPGPSQDGREPGNQKEAGYDAVVEGEPLGLALRIYWFEAFPRQQCDHDRVDDQP